MILDITIFLALPNWTSVNMTPTHFEKYLLVGVYLIEHLYYEVVWDLPIGDTGFGQEPEQITKLERVVYGDAG